MQRVSHGEAKFDTADSTTDHGDLGGHRPGGGLRLKISPSLRVGPKRFGPDAMGGKPGQQRQVRGDADVDRCQIIGDRAIRQMHPPRRPVDVGHSPKDQPRARETRQTHQINHQIIARIMPGHIARQHARVRRAWPRIDQRQSCTGQGGHSPTAQHQRVGVTAADQHQFSCQGGRHHVSLLGFSVLGSTASHDFARGFRAQAIGQSSHPYGQTGRDGDNLH